MISSENLISDYNKKIACLHQEIEAERKKVNRIFYSRLLIFICSFTAFFLLVQHSMSLAFSMVPVIILIFLILLKVELKLLRKIEFLKNRILINKKEIDLLENRLEEYDRGTEFIHKEHWFLADLDIFGNRSIFQLLNRTCTITGRKKLANWLCAPFLDKNNIIEHQQAVKALSTKLEWNQQFMAQGISNKENEKDKDVMEEWLKEGACFSSVFLKVASILLPLLTLLVLALQWMHLIDSLFFEILFIIQLLLVASYLKKTSQVHNDLSRKVNTVEKYAALISLLENESFDSKKLNELKQQLITHKEQASTSIRRLKKLVDTLDARLNIVVAVLLNGIFLFDINVMQRIENWKEQHKTDFLKWIAVIAEFDAFVSLGMHAYNHPDHCYPTVKTEQFTLHAENMGHPLISKNKLIRNNYTLHNLSRIDLLTGANMAGKSTFLRTIGVNLTLGMIGLPVCASNFTLTPIVLFTSLRTNDSLQENESFFYA